MKYPHRNSQKRIKFKDACYFVTFYTKHRYTYFKEHIFCDLFIENLRLCKKLKGFLLYGWVVIYEHVHLMIQPGDEYDISKVMFSIKKQFSHNANKVMGFNRMTYASAGDQTVECTTAPPLTEDSRTVRSTAVSPLTEDSRTVRSTAVSPLTESDQALGRFQPEGVSVAKQAHLQQTTHNFDLSVLRLKTRFSIKHLNKNPYPKFKWQKSFHDHYERCDDDFHKHLDYIAYNPTKHNLPTDWPYVYTNPKYINLCDGF